MLLAVFGALFASGDRAFAQIAGDVPARRAPTLHDLPLRFFVLGAFVSLAGGFRAGGADRRRAGAPAAAAARAHRMAARARRPECAVFASFVAVELAVLFGGDAYVRDSAGLTYAQYAREGFAQLVVVAALTLAVVAGALRPPRRPRRARHPA